MSDILNRVVGPQKSTTKVKMCPDFQNIGLTVRPSSDKPKESVHFLKSKNPKPLKERLTWQQKQRLPQTNKVFDSVAVNSRRCSG